VNHFLKKVTAEISGPAGQGPRATLPWTLRVVCWGIPTLMAVMGISFTLFENSRHIKEAGWPWLTVLGLIVLGLIGPALTWLSLRWASRTAEAYIGSKAELAQRNAELDALNSLALAANQTLDLQETLTAALEKTMETLDAAAGIVFLQGNGGPGLQLEAHRGISVEMAEKEAKLKPGHCLCGQAVETRQVLLASDVGDDGRCTSDLCICEGFRSVACAPLEVKGKLVGLLQLASPEAGHFGENQRDFVAAIARQVSASVENARLYDTVRHFNASLEQKVNQRTHELEAAQIALSEKAHQLQRLLSESYRVQEDTQARIAHDMHDGVTQIIVGALYETQAARQSLSADSERAAQCLTRAQQLLSEAETEIRRVIYDLHPPALDALGLAMALQQFARTFAVTFNIDCALSVSGRPRRLPHEIEIAIYRIAQAALHNVAAHAQAKRAPVALDFAAERLWVSIEDDGVGFDPESAPTMAGEHLGLIGMKERAKGIGAELSVSSARGQGTKIKLHLPSPQYLD